MANWMSPNPFGAPGSINPEYQRKYEAGVTMAKRAPDTFELLRELRATDADPVLIAGVEDEHRRRMRGPEPKLFVTRDEAATWIDRHNLQAMPHRSTRIGRRGWIVVVPTDKGVFGVVDSETMVLLEEW